MHSKLRSALLCTSLLVVCSSATLLAETFRNPYRIPTPTDPTSIAAGDLNGDGIADIVWIDVDNAPGTIKVLLSQPGGGYLPGADILAGSGSAHPGICVMTDVNRDAHLDLVCTGAFATQAYLWVFLGHGDGTFSAPVTTTPAPTTGGYAAPAVVALGDVNGDGLQDVLYEDVQNNIFLVMLSDGNGGFQAPKPLNDRFINDLSPIVADVNGDGIPDLLGPIGPEVALGNGDGTFGLPVNYAQPFDYLATCTYHDMDGDGHLDAVCGYTETFDADIIGATDLIILHGNADGSFNPTPIAHQVYGDHANQLDGFGTFQTPFAVTDLNGDGVLDILANAGDGLTVLMGGPGLTFAAPRHFASAVAGFGYMLPYQTLTLDMNGDGIVDQVSAGPNGIYISYGHADGSFGSAPAYETNEVIGYATVADFNGDGIPDVASTGDANIKVSLGLGDGTFAAPIAAPNQGGALDFSTPIWPTDAHIAHGDFNGDGKLDLLAIGSPAIYVYNNYLLLGNGDGTFQSPVLVPDSSTLYPMYSQLGDAAVYDVNHDGRSDLLSMFPPEVSGPDQIGVSLSNGDGSFRSVTTAVPTDIETNGVFSFPNTLPVLADFFGHGQLDAAYGSLNHVYVLKGHGDGTFDPTGTTLPLPAMANTLSMGAVSVASGDFDGDGKPDFVVLAQYGSTQYPYSPLATAAWVFYGNGDGTFAAPVLAGTFNRNYARVEAADLNRDGLTDLVLSTAGSLAGGYAVGVLNAQPGRSFAGEMNYTAGTGLSSLAISDLNRDGFPDLLFANGDFNVRAGSVTVLLNTGNAVAGTVVASPEPSNPGQPFRVTATLEPPVPGTMLTGNVSFLIDGNPLGTAALSNNAATFAAPGTFSAGVHQIEATWPGDGTYSPVDLKASHVVSAPAAPSTLSLTSSSNPAPALTPITFTAHLAVNGQSAPAGSAIELLGSTAAPIELTTDATGSASFTTSSLSAGTYLATANFSGTPASVPRSASLIQVVTPSSITATTITLSVSPNPAALGQPVTLSASVTIGGSAVSSGTISFSDGSTLLGTAAIGSSGYAILVTSSLAAGTHALTAASAASTTATASTSPVVQEVILPAATAPAFTLALAPSTLTMGSGTHASVTILLSSVGSFTGPLTLSYSALPPGVSASLQPATVTLSAGSSASSTLVLNTSALNTAALSPAAPVSGASASAHVPARWQALAAVFLLPALPLFGRRRHRRRLFGILLAAALLPLLTGCTTRWYLIQTDPYGTHQVTVTATDIHNNRQTANLTLVTTP